VLWLFFGKKKRMSQKIEGQKNQDGFSITSLAQNEILKEI